MKAVSNIFITIITTITLISIITIIIILSNIILAIITTITHLMSFKIFMNLGKWISAKRVVNHPNYGNHDNDIAVLEVSSLLIIPIQTCQSNY